MLVHLVDKDGPKVESKSGALPRADLDSWRGKSLMNMFSGDLRLLLLVSTCDGVSHGPPWLRGQTTTH